MIEYEINAQSPDELYHYGVKGMKWGVHRSARQYQRLMNQFDKQKSERTADYIKTDISKRQYDKKIEKYRKKNGPSASSNRIDRAISNSKALSKKANEYLRASQTIQKNIDRLIKEAKNEGYIINSKECVRQTHKGETYVAAFLGGPMASSSVMTANSNLAGSNYRTTYRGRTFDQSSNMVVGKKYRVR